MSSWSTYKSRPASPVNAAVTTSQLFPDLAIPTTPVIIPVPAGGSLEQKLFLIRASGVATTVGATTTGLASIYVAQAGVPAAPFTPGSWTLLCASTARVINTTSCPWFIEAEVIFDSLSGKLQGSFNAMTNNLYDAKAAIANVLTGISGASGAAVEPAFVIGVGFTFGVNAAVGNIARLGEFVLDS